MASNFEDCSKNSVSNEKLFDHLYFQILQNNKNELKSYDLQYLGVMREFIRQSDSHCHQQNMTTIGSENFKAELYSEYFKQIDSKEEKGLLPVVSCDKKQPRLNSVEKQNLMTMKIKPFINFLPNFKEISASDTESGALNLITKPSPFNSLKPAPEKRNPPFTINKNQTKSGSQNRGLMHTNTTQKRPLQKNKYEEIPGNSMHSNKKLCPPPKKSNSEVGFVSASSMYRNPLKKASNASDSNSNRTNSDSQDSVEDQHSELKNHDTLKHFDKKIVDIVLNEIMDFSPDIRWNDIAGLEFVKTTVQEIVIWPLLRPDIFTGLRAPPRGILLFGPPGTGKTLIGKCIATESNSTFFCISASSLASKWVGESEQMVRALFAAARLNQPAVIFIDEIDSLLSQRSDKDQDFSRKLKTEFLVQFDGAKTNTEERVLVVGATNRPHELDEAARRRFVKRLYVPLPDESARREIIKKLIEAHQHGLSDEDLQKICDETKGYSGSDVAHLCKEAAMGPIRCIGPENIKTVSLDQVRPIALCDFTDALRQVRASVVADDLNYYLEWNKKFGSFGIPS